MIEMAYTTRRQYVDWVIIRPLWLDVYNVKPTPRQDFKVRVLYGILCDN